MAFSERVSRLGDGLMRRVWSALAILPSVLLALWAGGVALLALLALAGIIMSYEWVRLLASTRPRKDGFLLSARCSPWLLVAYLASPGDALRLLLVLMFILGGLFWLFRWRVTPVVGGMAYLGWPLLAIAYFRDSASGGFVILYIFLTVWAVDIFAMFSGKLFGGPRMAPRISPNKTWAGLIGRRGRREHCCAHHLLFCQCAGCADADIACDFAAGRRAGRCLANGRPV